jgi:hypothetical protein
MMVQLQQFTAAAQDSDPLHQKVQSDHPSMIQDCRSSGTGPAFAAVARAKKSARCFCGRSTLDASFLALQPDRVCPSPQTLNAS